ncbi:MAG: YbaB/EbfC family nucleoid-associated protein [bacterium]
MNLGNMGKMLKQVQKMQAEMARVQEELGAARVEASAGGGVVQAVANGHGELISLVIDPAAVDPTDVAMLQDLVLAAVNEVQRNARTMAEGRMKAVTGDLPIPDVLR